MDSNLFIDTQSYQGDDIRSIGYFGSKYDGISTYRYEQEELQYLQIMRAVDHYNNYTFNLNEKIRRLKTRISNNLHLNNHSPHRFGGPAMPFFATIRDLLRDLGPLFNDRDVDGICNVLNDLRDCSTMFAGRVWSKLSDKDDLDITICSDCGTFSDSDTCNTTSNDERICEGCCNSNYLWSECMGTYIHENVARPVYHTFRSWRNEDPDDHCTRRYGTNNYSGYYNVFFSDDADYYDARRESGEDDDDGDDDDDSNRPTNWLAGWHGTTRNFVDKNVDKKYPSLGAELEVYIPNRDYFIGVTRDTFGTELILESDGSLCSRHGIEMITHPLGHTEWSAFAPFWFAHVQSHDGIGYNEPAGDKYGIHLTIHRDNFSPLAEARIAMFLSSTTNGNFIRAVAQRNQIYAASNDLGIGQCTRPQVARVCGGFEELLNERKGRAEVKIMGRGKFCPINFKNDLAEFRIFQSTTNVESFKKNLEFVWALWAWTKLETASGNSHHYLDFVKWLNKRQQRKQFPALISFLSKKVFYGTNFVPFISPWHGLMTKPTDDAAVESMAA